MQLFLKKYKNKEQKFSKYFKREYVLKHGNWYECYALRTPSTNNAIEATNNVLKTQFTLREKLPLGRFNSLLLDIGSSYSTSYVSEKSIKDRPVISKKDWQSAFTWLDKKIVPLKNKTNSKERCFYVPSTDYNEKLVGKLKISDVKKIQSTTTWSIFKDYLSNAFKIYDTRINMNDPILKSTCTCPSFLSFKNVNISLACHLT